MDDVDLDHLDELREACETDCVLVAAFDRDEREWQLSDDSESILAVVYSHGTPGHSAAALARYLAALANAAEELIELARRGVECDEGKCKPSWLRAMEVRERSKSRDKCRCGFYMPGPLHGRDCKHYAEWLRNCRP